MSKRYVITGVCILVGAVAGWVYWRYFGCVNGCTITGSPINSTLYGALMGGLLPNTFKRDDKK